MVLLPFKLFLSPTTLCIWDVHQTIPSDVYKQHICISYQILQMQYIPEEVINGFHEG